MAKTLIFSFLLFLFYSDFAFALDENKIGKRANSFLKLVSEEHLQPADINSEKYRLQVLDYLLELLDSDKSIFTLEDEAEFKLKLNILAEDFKNQKIDFLKLVNSKYNLRITKLKKFTENFFKEPFKTNSTLSVKPIDLDKRSSDANQINNWLLSYRYEILNSAIEIADSTQLNLDSLNILVQQYFSETGADILTYFEDESEIDLFFEDCYLNALAMSFDPHTSYFNLVQEKEFVEELSGNRELFGFSLDKNNAGNFFVDNLVPGSPAWISGEIETNDIVLQIKFDKNKTINLRSLSMSELENMFAQSNAKVVTLTIEEDDKSLRKVILEKTLVQLDGELVKSAILVGEKKVGYITLPDFYTSWDEEVTGLGCANDVAKAILKMKKENIEGLIIDLRGNGGGSLKEAVDLVGIFIDYGPVLITRNNKDELNVIKDFNRGSIYSAPLIILIDEGSASASEIVAAALQDHKRALIVGQTSFGKSTGQSILPIIESENINNGEGFAKITMDGIYRIDLSSHQGVGVVPDLKLPDFFEEDDFRENDIANSLKLDPIDKKVYYEALNFPETSALQTKSDQRVLVDSNFIEIKILFDKLKLLYAEDRTIVLSLSDLLNEQLQINEIISNIRKWKKELKVDFETQNSSFDNEIYKDGSLMKQYNDFFLNRLSKDYELNETYHIMMDLINAKSNN